MLDKTGLYFYIVVRVGHDILICSAMAEGGKEGSRGKDHFMYCLLNG